MRYKNKIDFHWVVMLMFALSCKWAAAQGDSVLPSTGSIKVVRPDLKPVILVKHTYFIFSNKRDARKWSSGKKVADILVKSDLDASQTITTEVPYPAFDSLVNSNIHPDFNWQRYIEKNLHFVYTYKEAPVLDTVRIKIEVSKFGKYSYSFIDKNKSKKLVDQKCMALLYGINKWKPAIMYKNSALKKGSTEKRTWSGIVLTIILSANPFTESISDK